MAVPSTIYILAGLVVSIVVFIIVSILVDGHKRNKHQNQQVFDRHIKMANRRARKDL